MNDYAQHEIFASSLPNFVADNTNLPQPSKPAVKTNMNRTVLTLNERSSRFDELELRTLEHELYAVKDEPLKELPHSNSNSIVEVKTMASALTPMGFATKTMDQRNDKPLLNTNSSMILNLDGEQNMANSSVYISGSQLRILPPTYSM